VDDSHPLASSGDCDSKGGYQSNHDGDNFALQAAEPALAANPGNMVTVASTAAGRIAPVIGDITNWMVAKHLASTKKQSTIPPYPPAPSGNEPAETSHQAPLSLYNSIQQRAKESASLGHDPKRQTRPRSKVLTELEDRFDFQSSRFQPTVISYIPDERPTVIYVSSFTDAVYSLLSNPEVIKEHNLLFPNPLLPYLTFPNQRTQFCALTK
jgi:hypothetical protein